MTKINHHIIPGQQKLDAEVTRLTNDKKVNKGDVFTHNGVSYFPNDQKGYTASIKNERARIFLEQARAALKDDDGSTQSIFGGRVSRSSYNPQQSLKEYYKSSIIGEKLYEELKTFENVSSVYGDLIDQLNDALPQDLFDKASLTKPAGGLAEPAAPAGTKSFSLDNQSDFTTNVHDWVEKLDASGKWVDFAPDDITLKGIADYTSILFTSDIGQETTFSGHTTRSGKPKPTSDQNAIQIARVYARAAELGVNFGGECEFVGPQSLMKRMEEAGITMKFDSSHGSTEPLEDASKKDKTATKAVADAALDVFYAPRADRESEIQTLSTLIRDKAGKASVAELLQEAVAAIRDAERKNVADLKQADVDLGGVSAATTATISPFAPGTKIVNIAGVENAENTDPNRDMSRVPRKDKSDLVMTETTKTNLRRISVAWRNKKACLLEGPTSAGKTSAVRYMAYKTGTPYRRINLSGQTDVSDLLGRMVGGQIQYPKTELNKFSKKKLLEIAVNEMKIPSEDVSGLTEKQIREEIDDIQRAPRWIDGPVIRAMKNGECLLLDEVNLAQPEVIERLNSLLDDNGCLVLDQKGGEVVHPHENFRIFATMNPAGKGYSGRAKLSKAMKSRWNCIWTEGLNIDDVKEIMIAKYGQKIPDAQLAQVLAVHDNLSRAADEGLLGSKSGGMAFTLRNLFRVADRFVRYKDSGINADTLLRREIEEVYLDCMWDEDDRNAVTTTLSALLVATDIDIYKDLKFVETPTHITLGDVTMPKINASDPRVPPNSSRLVMTARTKAILYKTMKAFDMGENPALIGERASGKSAVIRMLAHLLGQPFYLHNYEKRTDLFGILGFYDLEGWNDGMLTQAIRPENTPGVYVAEELNLANPAILERLNSLLDDERSITLAEKDGELVRAHKEFKFAAAMNPPKKGYGGRNKISKALQNRLTMIYVPTANTAAELNEILAAIGSKIGVPEIVTQKMVDVHMQVAQGYEDDVYGKDLKADDKPEVSIRSLISALKTIKTFQGELGTEEAYVLAMEQFYASSRIAEDNAAIMAEVQKPVAG